MCALHPSLRNDWARTWTKVVKSGGYLIALEYPIRPDDKTGPPWPVSPQIYADLLMPLGRSSCLTESTHTNISPPPHGVAIARGKIDQNAWRTSFLCFFVLPSAQASNVKFSSIKASCLAETMMDLSYQLYAHPHASKYMSTLSRWSHVTEAKQLVNQILLCCRLQECVLQGGRSSVIESSKTARC